LRILSVQLQPDRVSDFDATLIVERLQQIGNDASGDTPPVDEGYDAGRYINVTFGSENVRELWDKLRNEIDGNLTLARYAIVCCEGEDGWNDYLLLHHFDPAIARDLLA
jgi:hypothetical protein